MLCIHRLRSSPVKLGKRRFGQDVVTSIQAISLHTSPGIESPHEPSSCQSTRDALLLGKSIAIKDNIVMRDQATAASSLALEQYRSPFDATVIKLLREGGATVQAGFGMDEFGMGSHSQYSYSEPVVSPYTRGGVHLSPGGSSGGSAVAVATGACWAALGTDTGGSVRLPAAYTGVAGFKPSYGLLSRWGVIQYANSLDTVGILAPRIANIRDVFACLNRFDALDPTSLPESVRTRIQYSFNPQRRRRDPRSIRIGIPHEYNIAELADPVKQTYISLLHALQSAGHTLHPVSLPSTRLALSAYYILAPAEASSNLAKFDGVRYGFRSSEDVAPPPPSPSSPPSPPSSEIPTPPSSTPLYAPTRSAAFGPEVQRRILLGAYGLSAAQHDNFFAQAQRVRRRVQRDFDRVFAAPHPLLSATPADLPTSGGGGIGDTLVRREDGREGRKEKGEQQGGGRGGDEGKEDERVDVLIVPTAPTRAPTIEEVRAWTPVEGYVNDVFTVPASLAGLPAISVPVPWADSGAREETDVPTVGMQVVGQFGDDAWVLDVAEMIENLNQRGNK